MRHALLIASLLLLLSATAVARPSDPEPSRSQLAEAHARQVTDAEAYLAQVDTYLALAEEGAYGRLRRGSISRLQSARDRIAHLLEGHQSATELPPDERIALYNAQELITGILKNDDKGRQVCRREVRTGSRLPTTECLTVAEIEARRDASRDTLDRLQRHVCYPGEGNPCTK